MSDSLQGLYELQGRKLYDLSEQCLTVALSLTLPQMVRLEDRARAAGLPINDYIARLILRDEAGHE